MSNYAIEYYGAAAVFPLANQVVSPVTFGPTGADFTGTVVVGGGVGYPAVGDVQLSVVYGASNEFIGTLALPTEAQVQSGVGYGAGGTEFTGTLTTGGGGDQWATDLVAGGYTGDEAGAVLLAILAKANLITGSDMFIAVDRVTNGTITMYKGEATTVTVPLSEDTTGLTLRFAVEDSYGDDILTIANGDIARTSSNFTVTITTAVTDELANHTWALRDITGGINRVVRKGVLTVQAAADNDA
jgi:hypothetical protein